MRVTYKSTAEIKAMREGGKILGKILLELAKKAQPGITTGDLDKQARELIKKYDVKGSFLGYRGFPAVICTAVNEEVVHTIPGKRILQEGDILTIDCGVYHKGLHTDSAISIGIGRISPERKKMIEVGEEALLAGIKLVKSGTEIKKISKAIQEIIEKNGYRVIRELIGHGVGYELHEDPPIPNYEGDAASFILKAGMTIAIEPIFCVGKAGIKTESNGWNIITKDGSLAMQVEHTVLVTEDRYEILTSRERNE